jgi:hypothetical protein
MISMTDPRGPIAQYHRQAKARARLELEQQLRIATNLVRQANGPPSGMAQPR